MNQIAVSPKFFKKERNNYKDFRFAFWRELLQNSVDAGASKINIGFVDGGRGNSIVDFSDNGSGFNADVRDNVFFCLGETDKGKEGDIGGFGKARIVVCFSQNNYQVMSQDWKAWGEGGSYEVESLPAYYPGCKVTVDADASSDDLYRSLRQYLSLSQLDCDIFINDVKWNEWCYRRRLTQRLSFGDVYVNKSGGTHGGFVIVRVNGLPMFTRFANIKAQVVVEIDADRSREVLLSNRDMLHSTYQSELDEFIRKISIDTESGLRKDRTKWIVCPGNSKITKRKTKREALKETGIVVHTDIGMDALVKETYSGSKKYVLDCWDIDRIDINKIDDIIPSAVIALESDNPKVRKVFPRYDMRLWSGADDGGNRKKLLRQWTMICDYAVEEYLEFRDTEEMFWRPGFIFSDNSAAKHFSSSTDGQKEDIFLLNPVDEDGKMIFGLRNKDSWTKMILLACHEVAHHSEGYHNESFVSVSEHLFEKLFCRREEIFRSLKKSLQKRSVLC